MKLFKNFLILTLVVAIAFGCSSNDDGGAGNNGSDTVSTDNLSKILGTWLFVSSSTNGVVDPIEGCEQFSSLIFTTSQVSIQEVFGDNCSETQSTSEEYSINGNTLNVGGFIVDIKTINSTTLVVEYTEDGDEITETYNKQ